MIRYGLIACCALLAGCGTVTPVTRTQYIHVSPSSNLYKCNGVVLPNPNGLTDLQVAKTLEQLYKANRQCQNSLAAIKAFEARQAGIIH